MIAAADRDARVRALLADAVRALSSGRIADAERDVVAALELAPIDVRALHVRALVQHRNGRPDLAVATLRQALALRPHDASLLNSLGTNLLATGDEGGALQAFGQACESAPRQAAVRANFGKALVDSGALRTGIAELETALELDPALHASRFTLAYALRLEGRVDAAAAQLRTVLQRSPHDGDAWLALADMDMPIDERDLATMQEGLASAALRGRSRVALGFALARVLEARECHAEAWDRLLAANAQARASEPWDAVAARERRIATLAAFAGESPALAEQGGEVVFIVGLPRSGTTLVEQIISSHPLVEGGGELPDAPAVISEELRRHGGISLARWSQRATAADWLRLGRDYLARTERRRPCARFTDKLPGNWLLVGALQRMLPAARVVVCRRDPLDNALACFSRLFAPRAQPFSYDIADIAAYWHDFDSAACAWAERFPGFVHVQQLEALRAEPAAQIPALLEFCGLPFDPACLEFQRNTRAVRTHSALQVRRPLHAPASRAIGYGALLDPLRAALARAQ
jgi:Tfp pilus assembly protein PilF